MKRPTSSHHTASNADGRLKQSRLTENYSLSSPISYGQRRRSAVGSSQRQPPVKLVQKQTNQHKILQSQAQQHIQQSTPPSQSPPQTICFPLGLDIDSQCSTLHYHRIHPKEKIKQLNRTHGGWIEPQGSDAQQEYHQESHQDGGRWLEETADHGVMQPNVKECEKNQQDGWNQVQPEHSAHDLLPFNTRDGTNKLMTTNSYHQQVLGNEDMIGNPESFLPMLSPKNPSASGAIFFDDGYLEQETESSLCQERSDDELHQPRILCLDSSDPTTHHDDQQEHLPLRISASDPRLEPGHPDGSLRATRNDQDGEQYAESCLGPRTQKPAPSSSFAIFFDSQYLSSNKENQSKHGKISQGLSHPDYKDYQTKLPIHQTCDQLCHAEDVNLGSYRNNEKVTILAEDTQQERSLKTNILAEDTQPERLPQTNILAEDSQEQASPTSLDLVNRSLAPPTPISNRTPLFRKSPDPSSPPSPLNFRPKNQDVCTKKITTSRFSSSAYSTTFVEKEDQLINKEKHNRSTAKKNTITNRILAAWSTPPEFKVLKPDSSKTFRQIQLTEFLEPVQPSSSTMIANKISTSYENEEIGHHQVKTIEKKLIHSHLNTLNRYRSDQLFIPSSKNNVNNGKGKEKENNGSEEEEEEEEIDDDDMNSCSTGILEQGKIPDSQLSTSPSNKTSRADTDFNDDKLQGASDREDRSLISRFRDRIDRACIRQSIYQHVSDHDQNDDGLDDHSQKLQEGGQCKHHADLDHHHVETFTRTDDDALLHHHDHIQSSEFLSAVDHAPDRSELSSRHSFRQGCDHNESNFTSSDNEIKGFRIGQERLNKRKLNREENQTKLTLDHQNISITNLDNSHPIFSSDNLVKISQLILLYSSQT